MSPALFRKGLVLSRSPGMAAFAGLIAASALLVSAAVAGSCGSCQPAIHEPVARLAFSAAKSAAVYLRIENSCGRRVLLSGADSPSALRAELHSSVEGADGVVLMRKVSAPVAIAPGETLALQPSGLHIMLIGLNSGDGGAVTLTLSFVRSDDVSIMAQVRVGQ